MAMTKFPDFECPHCKTGFYSSEEPDWYQGLRNNRWTYECGVCESTVEIDVDWDPMFYVLTDTLKVKNETR